MRSFNDNLANPAKFAKGHAPGGKGKTVEVKKIGGPKYAERERRKRLQTANR